MTRLHDHRPERRPRRRGPLLAVAAAATGAVLLAAAVAPGSSSADPSVLDPSAAPVPALEPEDDAKSIVATVSFDDRDTATPTGAEVRFGRAHTRIGDPPLLRLRVLDEDGALISQFNAWHPLWAFVETAGGGEDRIILDQAEGRFTVPFDRDAVSMSVIDVPLGEEVAEVDLTKGIRDFCLAHPGEPECRIADLAVTRVEATSVPALALVGQTVSVEIETEVTNLGPSEPVDATVSLSATAPAGVSVTPTAASFETALDLAEDVVDARSYDVSCLAPGQHDIVFGGAIEPSDAADVDLVSTNNQKSVTLTVDCVTPVTINIMPGGSPSPINLRAVNGSIPVAVLTTAVGEYGNPIAFDATSIVASSARFGKRTTLLGGGGAVPRFGRGQVEDSLELDDRTRDGDLDQVFQFLGPRETGLRVVDTEACAFGTYTGSGGASLRFFGCGEVRVIR